MAKLNKVTENVTVENEVDSRKTSRLPISAADARHIADTSTKAFSRIYKVIREEAEEGRTAIQWCVYDFSKVLIQSMIDELEAKGYKVYPESNCSEVGKITDLSISW